MAKTAAILLSRQALRPTGDTPWVQQTARAVRWVQERGYALSSSHGMQTWEFVTALGADNRVPLKLYLPGKNRATIRDLTEQLMYEFDLRHSHVEVIPVLPEEGGESKDDLRQRRDEAIVAEADLLIPISLRSGGRMERLIEQSDKEVVSDFKIEYDKRSTPIGYELDPDTLNPVLDAFDRDDYLIHWTRGTHHAWPGERLIQFYLELLVVDRWPRSGIETLLRILRMRRIIASGRHMPANARTVAFSGLPPKEVAPLMRYRARYQEMSFEPYGVGIEKTAALEAGVEPVYYYDETEDPDLDAVPVWRRQSAGQVTDWRQEQEYRHEGDFQLHKIHRDAIVLFTRTNDEAKFVEAEFGFRTLPFEQ